MSFLDNLRVNLGFRPNTGTNVTNQDDEYYTITPEQDFYEIILIRPKTIEDMDYVYDQIVEENNPVILDLGFIHRKGRIEFNTVGERIKELRDVYNCESVLISQDSGRYVLLLSPSRVKIRKKQ